MGLHRTALVALLLATVFAVVGCTHAEEPDSGLEPTVAPPVIAEEGVLRVGVDLDFPPYAGTDKGREAGIDVDVASALAAELGLELELVEVPLASAAGALASRDIDIAMSVPFTEASVVEVAFAGWYAATGPALFSSVDETPTAQVRGARATAAQEGSEAYWDLVFDLGEDQLFVTETLREAFEALENGEVETVAGDALTGAYLLRDFSGLAFAGQLGPATPLGIAVAPDATELEVAIRSALDRLAASGVLDTVRAKWVDDLPELETGEPGEGVPGE